MLVMLNVVLLVVVVKYAEVMAVEDHVDRVLILRLVPWELVKIKFATNLVRELETVELLAISVRENGMAAQHVQQLNPV